MMLNILILKYNIKQNYGVFMKITVAGQHMSVGASLDEYVQAKLGHIADRYFEHAISANVHFLKHGYLFKCDIIVHEGTGRHAIIKSDAECDDVYSCFDMAAAKCEKQLRRYKSRLKDRHNKVKLSEADLGAVKYVIEPNRDDGSQDSDNPVIIAEQKVSLEDLTVSEAVMKMDLENLPALMFKNIKNGRLNIVYYRTDGNISWVDSVG